MEPTGFAVVIMAAGKGTRLKSKRPKVLHEVGGRALLLHVIAAAKTLAPTSEIFCIVGHEAERVQTAVARTGVNFVLQEVQRGTGHALQVFKAWLELSVAPLPKHLLVLSGDVPLIRPETIAALCEFHLNERAAMTILTAVPKDPTGYGRVLRAAPGSAEVKAIVEHKALAPEQLGAPEINSGIYCFETEALFSKLDLLSTNNAHGEFYLTDVAALLVGDGQRVVAIAADSVDEVLGANTIAEMMHLDAAMRTTAAARLMAQGVTIFRPDTCVIDAEVEVGADTVIEPYVQLLGATRVGSECRIRSYSVLQSSVLGDGVTIRNGCVLDSADVADGALIGPYAHLRPASRIGERAHVGNFCETKNVTLGAGSGRRPMATGSKNERSGHQEEKTAPKGNQERRNKHQAKTKPKRATRAKSWTKGARRFHGEKCQAADPTTAGRERMRPDRADPNGGGGKRSQRGPHPKSRNATSQPQPQWLRAPKGNETNGQHGARPPCRKQGARPPVEDEASRRRRNSCQKRQGGRAMREEHSGGNGGR